MDPRARLRALPVAVRGSRGWLDAMQLIWSWCAPPCQPCHGRNLAGLYPSMCSGKGAGCQPHILWHLCSGRRGHVAHAGHAHAPTGRSLQHGRRSGPHTATEGEPRGLGCLAHRASWHATPAYSAVIKQQAPRAAGCPVRIPTHLWLRDHCAPSVCLMTSIQPTAGGDQP